VRLAGKAGPGVTIDTAYLSADHPVNNSPCGADAPGGGPLTQTGPGALLVTTSMVIVIQPTTNSLNTEANLFLGSTTTDCPGLDVWTSPPAGAAVGDYSSSVSLERTWNITRSGTVTIYVTEILYGETTDLAAFEGGIVVATFHPS
jgi:hypothetical protein